MLDWLKNSVVSPLIIEGPQHSETLAELARRALCSQGNACGECSNCKKSFKNSHPDWIQCTGSLKMEELRAKLYELRHRPFSADLRVLSFENLQDCNLHIQNALLKTLEEPLSYWTILIGVRSSHGLVSTIRSRCLILRLSSKGLITELNEDESEIFDLIRQENLARLQTELEKPLKNREQTRELFIRLLSKASETSYPGFWKSLAPSMEEAVDQLERNLNPKTVFDRLWSSSKQAC